MEEITKECRICEHRGTVVCGRCRPVYIPKLNRTVPSDYKEISCCMPRSARLSFREAFCRAASQTEISACTDARSGQMRELCYIIAEVYMMNPDSAISVGGELLGADLVQGVFEELRYPHIEMVTDNFEKEARQIKNKKAYLRTALYNSVFELEAHYTNLVRCDGSGTGNSVLQGEAKKK